ncbi:hypothetical protein BJ741DRAFT_712966 [Chytriomyces cf. hyalinus JEL632]|nr:hypothetical protein BJ741DRAFT_712966 [Chytriomyces cf. hyalinus JEL632]
MPSSSNNNSKAVLLSVMQRLDDIEQSLWTHANNTQATRESAAEDMQVVEALFDTEAANPVAEKLVAHVSSILEKQAVPRLLQWIYESQYPSGVAAMMILANNQDLPLSHTNIHLFMLHAIAFGWREVVQTLMDRGFEVSNHGNHALETAADQDKCEMVKLLLQDRRVDLSYVDYRIVNLINSLEMAEVFLLDDRIPNGQFLLSVLQGDIEAVEAMLAEKDWDPTQPGDWCLKLATNQNRPDILELLLSDERVQLKKETQNVCMKLAVERPMWRVFDSIADKAIPAPNAEEQKCLSAFSFSESISTPLNFMFWSGVGYYAIDPVGRRNIPMSLKLYSVVAVAAGGFGTQYLLTRRYHRTCLQCVIDGRDKTSEFYKTTRSMLEQYHPTAKDDYFKFEKFRMLREN